MSFCVSHRTALDKNIRHIYSGVSTDIRFRNYGNSADAAMDIHDRIWERHRRPPNRFETKFLEYNQDYRARMPRAPAFRQANTEEVNEITSRLTRPTLMTVLRQQPAVASRAGSSSPGRSSGKRTERSDSETPDVRHRKISYKEWSDDGSDVYYIDDSFLEDSSTGHHKKDGNSGDVRNEYNNPNEERDLLASSSQQLHDNPSQDVMSSKESPERPNHMDNNENESDEEKTNDDKDYEKPEISSHGPSLSVSQSESPTSETPQRKGQSKKQKLNILEEIIQTRNQIRHRNVQAQKSPSPSPVRDRRKLEHRGRINNKLSRSPYSQPSPYLGSRPIRYQRQGNNTKRTQPRTPSPGVKISDSSDHRESQECSSSSEMRPQTQASISRPRRDRLTSQYRPESRGTAVYLRPTRSKSAPGYKIHDDRRGVPKKRDIHSNSSDNEKNTKTTRLSNAGSRQSNNSNGTYRKSQNELEENSDSNNDSVLERTRQDRRMRHQSSKSAKAYREPSSAQPRSQSEMASRPIELSKRHSPRNPDDVRYTHCCMPAVENDLLVRFGVEPKGQRPFYVSNSNRRYASAAEMEAANRRLMAPTAAKLIRDRMRWAPNNDNDLADPVKVIRETVERKSRNRKSKSCNGIAWDDFDMDSDGQREEDEGSKNNTYRDCRLTDKENGGRGKSPNLRKGQGRHFSNGRFIRNDKDDRDDVHRHDDDKTYKGREKATPAAIDFKDRQGAAAITKPRDREGKRATRNASRANRRSRSRSASLSSKSGSNLRSRSPSRSRSRSSYSKSRSRSRSRSTSAASKSRSRSRSQSTSAASKSRSRSRSRSRSSSRSRSGERASERSRSSSPLVSGGCTQTELESGEDVKPKVDFEASAETTSSGEERGKESWTPEGPSPESSWKKDHGPTQQQRSNYDRSASSGNLQSDTSSDVHRANPETSPEERPGSMKPPASGSSTSEEVGEDRSRWEDGAEVAPGARSKDSNAERAGDDFLGRGQENENRGQERASHAQIDVRATDDGRNATQNVLHSSGSDDPGVLYTVQKGYALETDGGSSYYSTDYNADVTDAEEGTTRGAYHRVLFHDES